MTRVRTVVVDRSSAVIGLAGHREHVVELDRDHRQICKLAKDSEYDRVARHLKRLADTEICRRERIRILPSKKYLRILVLRKELGDDSTWLQTSYPCVAQNSQSAARQPHNQLFEDCLTNEHRAPWLVIFDNAYQGLDLRDLLPSTGGKVIITSRHTGIKTDVPFITKVVPPLAIAEATDLFFAKRKQYHRSERNQAMTLPSPSPSPSVASVFGELCDRPLAIIFAASRVAPMRWVVAQEHIQILDAEETPDAGNLDMKIWKWFCHLLDFLALLSIFDSTRMEDEFIDWTSHGILGFFSERHTAGIATTALALLQWTFKNMSCNLRTALGLSGISSTPWNPVEPALLHTRGNPRMP
ncbi:uncharacterized protein PAC_11807 [Phialocephala subalpina]|uniref:Uncharacterized protein n=1 Tax=Phialocephala subalpina TaxID=576137 RepID=A0A1L7XA56_9HELO|nr:uncharacterized protein PAC_11807 [Phialocephala subalpina]